MKSHILFFLKYPECGKVKTRLAKEVGDDQALNLTLKFIKKTLIEIGKSGIAFKVCYSPSDRRREIEVLMPGADDYIFQGDGDLGERMAFSFKRHFLKDSNPAILIGSDIPEITSTILIEASQKITDLNIVFGPSSDGGYYLVAIHPEINYTPIFYGIEWSRSDVLERSVNIVKKTMNSEVILLKELTDIDNISDLKKYQACKTSENRL